MRSEKQKKSKSKSKFKLVLKILFAPVYFLIAGEVFLRVFAPVPMIPRYVCASEYGIRQNDPNRSYWHTTPEYYLQFRTNSKGIRADEEIPYEKPDSVKRIVMLGDSFGMGYGVDLEDTFTKVLERSLKKQGLNCQVVNLSVSGHGNAEELITLKEEGFKYQPDLVLLAWHGSDLRDNVRSNLYALEDGKLVRKNKTYLPGVKAREILFKYPAYGWIAENSYFYNFFREWAAVKIKKILVKVNEKKSDDAAEQSQKQAREKAKEYRKALTVSIIEEIDKECIKRDISFLLLDIPYRRNRTEFYSVLPDKLGDNPQQIDIVSPLELFNKLGNGRKLYWEKSHGHFTPLGCEIVGQALADEIIRKGLL